MKFASLKKCALVAVALAVGLAQTAAAIMMATGGNATNDSVPGYRIHTFTNSGAFTLSVDGNVEVLVVGGGGGGGETIGGGGGGGGVIYSNVYAMTAGVYAVTVGIGGAGGWDGSTAYPAGTKGTNSIFSTLTAIGGGAGAGFSGAASGTGGSAGGNGGSTGARAGYTPGQGKDGGNSDGNNAGGGGGGFSQAGTAGASGVGGVGGTGFTSMISGASAVYGSGGGGGTRSPGTGGAGGAGGPGGGAGGTGANPGTNGTATIGGGGGGGGYQDAPAADQRGGNGGSGVVIVRYAFTSGPTVNNASGATNVTAGSAWLNGTLVSTGGAPTTVSVYWGPTNGGVNTSAWAYVRTFPGYPTNGTAFTTNVTIETSNTMHFYRYYATNGVGESWADSTTNFMPGSVWVTATTTNASELPGYPGVFTISRPETATNGDLTVYYTLSGAATNGVDYTLVASNVTILAGNSNATVTINPIFDLLPEPSEDVTLTLTPGTYAIGTPSTDTIWIQDSVAFTNTPVIKTWTGTNNWNVAANWNPVGVPVWGDDVRINSGLVTLTNATPVLYAFTLASGTVNFSNNWNAYIAASNVVLTTGTVTHATNTATASPWTPDNRVYFRCYSFTMATSCTINVAGKGYQNPATATSGRGPGRGLIGSSSNSGGGGGNGGPGGASAFPGAGGGAYGVSNAPTEPGSSGSTANSASGGAGGGAVRIEATGEVNIEGTINANGVTAGGHSGGGAGGAIYISCNDVRGNGTVTANGGYGAGNGGAGGGGCIAVTYDPAAQTGVIPQPTFTFSVNRGVGINNGGLGTLYLSDSSFFPVETLTNAGFRIMIPGFTNWAPNNLTFSNCSAEFPADCAVRVTNSLAVYGSNVLVTLPNLPSVGGIVVDTSTQQVQWISIYGPLTVGSNVVVKNGGGLHWYGGVTNSATCQVGTDIIVTNGATLYFQSIAATTDLVTQVTVAGDIFVAASSYLYPVSQGTNGSSPQFSCQDFTLAQGGTVWAKGMGFMKGTLHGSGYPLGGGLTGGGYGNAMDSGTGAGGGGHGGRGGLTEAGGLYGYSYDSYEAPAWPGSAGGSKGAAAAGASGGGLVRIIASGDITVAGTINADGTSVAAGGGGGAGGGVYLNGNRVLGNGTITANGGYGGTGGGGCAGGGGGCIAVVYDKVAQVGVTQRPAIQFSANRGLGAVAAGALGTLYLSDSSFFPVETLTNAGYRIMIPGFTNWAPTNLTFSNCSAEFPADCKVSITNDLILMTNSTLTLSSALTVGRDITVTGPNSTLTLTNVALTVGRDVSVTGTSSALWIYCGTNTVNVGRHLTPDKGGKVYIVAGISNGLPPYYAALVSVTNGDVTIGSNAYLYSISDPTNGGSLKFSLTNLTIAAGGTFSAKEYGFAGGVYSTHTLGWGPGGGGARDGGGYAGLGAQGNDTTLVGGGTYGVPEMPIDPGSGSGQGQTANNGKAGGGLVWIEATNGDVTVEGTIDADGGLGTADNVGGGSGGAVFINCRRFLGVGAIHAMGGNGVVAGGGGGGGGRIALICDSAVQSGVTPKPTVQYSVAGGSGNVGGGRGTLYLASLDLFYALCSQQRLTGGYQLIVPGLTEWTWTNDLVATNCDILLPTGMRLTVSNDLSLAASAILTLTNVDLTVGRDVSVTGTSSALWIYCNTNAGLTVGRDISVTGTTSRLYISCRTNAVRVGRNMTVNRGGGAYIYAGASNGAPPYYAGLVSVDGDLTIGTNANLYPVSNSTNGGSLKFAVQNLTVAAGGVFNAYALGYSGSTTNGYGPGRARGDNNSGGGGGAGYGGLGGNGSTYVGGTTYGSSNAPIACGSAGGNGQGGSAGGSGGGLVWVEAGGTIWVDGIINANGGNGPLNQCGGGSGGGIYLTCNKLQGNGGLWAKGGTGAGVNGGAGGGGRIAIWRKSSDLWYGTPILGNDGTNAIGGTNTSTTSRSGGRGTIYWKLLPSSGSVIWIK